ncbi:hypothetical protein COCNU_09G009670 [Cocos nucifera]|uniref:Translation initiation factor eIF2B subunit epsilon n=1 Tax=Cocos nucifera TaxID=13894 RepID=A0A8K0N7T2_COCNU|nr:hypothetical protein COCNU_09G009670 [Cocos nucifera]
MAQKKGHRSSSSDDPEELARVPLQAVLLADSFATKFRPITLERPKVLLPLVNAPMIDYTLAWLESVGVEEAFVFCCAHSQQVKDYLNKSQWMKQPGTFTVQPIESHDSISAGDALRVIYNLGVIHGDFVLVSGDTVSNMSLKVALQEHKERRKKDPLAVMTMVIKHSKPSSLTHQTRLGNDEILMAIDPDTKELLYYEDKTDQSQRFITLDKMLLASTPTLHLHNDKQVVILIPTFVNIIFAALSSLLIYKGVLSCPMSHECWISDCSRHNLFYTFLELYDLELPLYKFPILMGKRLIPVVLFFEILKDCYIDICSPEVLSLFTDNFDYQHLRRHFVKGLLVDDLMGYKIFTHEIHSSYAARIDNFRSYDTISKDIIQRWTYPMVPDVQYFGNCSQMKLDRLGIYKAPDVDQSRTAQIRAFSFIGNGTTIGDHSVISYSVIGQSCSIGCNVSIQGSYIWDNVIIEDNCKLSHALVCDGVYLRAGVVLEPGVILSFKVDISGVGYIWSTTEGGHEEEWRHSIAPIPAEKLMEFSLSAHTDLGLSNQDVNSLPASGELQLDSESTGFDDGEDYKDSADFEKEIEVLLKFEEMCSETTKEFAPLFSAILNHLYEKDILSEDAILSWAEERGGADESDKIFLKQSEPFLKWLREASEDEDD